MHNPPPVIALYSQSVSATIKEASEKWNSEPKEVKMV
jgi:hypothetical protein